MTLRSGSDKTKFNEKTDLLKIGIKNGQMLAELPDGLSIGSDYRPSFDTKVILAHAVGNAIIATVLAHFNPQNQYSMMLSKNGISISHWHGYFNDELLPEGIESYGSINPHVSCSSPQSAIYALEGKFEYLTKKIQSMNWLEQYRGDIHIEPHHGINVVYPSLRELARYIIKHPDSTSLGNKYI